MNFKKIADTSYKFDNYKKCLLNDKIILKSQQRFRIEAYVFTEEINNIALITNNGKLLQTFDGITSYPYDASIGKVCKTELSQYLNTE